MPDVEVTESDTCVPLLIVKLTLTLVAAVYEALPACDADREQVPILNIVTLKPSTLQVRVVATTVGVNPLEAVTVTTNGVELIVLGPGLVKVRL